MVKLSIKLKFGIYIAFNNNVEFYHERTKDR